MTRWDRLLRPLAIVALLSACATPSSSGPASDEAEGVQATPAADDVGKPPPPGHPGPDEDVVAIDTNGDGKPDVFKYYPKGKAPTDSAKPDSGGPLLRAERDLNGDGKIDVWTWYNPDGTKRKESFDLDFDGKIDLIVYYEKGQIIRKEYYTAGRDKPDVFKYYDKGKLVRVERDRKGTGKIDTWEYWDGDQLDRIGEDVDGDGQVDRWIKPPPKGG